MLKDSSAILNSGGTLSLTGSLDLPTTTSSTGLITQGGARVLHTYGTGNVFAGTNAGNLTMTGDYNAACGESCLTLLTSGFCNTAIGSSALKKIDNDQFNTAVGYAALENLTTGDYNTVLGAAAGRNTAAIGSATLIGVNVCGAAQFLPANGIWPKRNTPR